MPGADATERRRCAVNRLFGREIELARIDHLIDDTVAGRSAVFVIVGAAGFGKTTLLDAAAARADGRGVRVLRMTGFEGDIHIAFGGLVELLRPVHAALTRLDVRSADALRSALSIGEARASERFAVSVAVFELLATVAEGEPLLCLIDDLQWLDRSSTEALTFALRRLHDDRVGFLVASREPPVLSPGTRVHRLRPLSEADATALVRANHTGLPEVEVASIVESCLGVPLELVELARHDTAGRTGSVLFEQRVRELSESSLLAALIVAVDAEVDPRVIQQAFTHGHVHDIDAAAVETAGLIERSASTWTVAHPLARAAIVGVATPSLRRRAHQAWAAALHGGADVERCIWHLAGAAAGPDDSIAERLMAIGERCVQRGDQAAASRAFDQAARLATRDPRRVELLTRAGLSATAAGMDDSPFFSAALALATDPAVRDQLNMFRCLAASSRGDWEFAPDIARRLGADIQSRSPAIARVVYSCATGAAFQRNDYELLSSFASVAAGIGDGLGSTDGPMLLAEINAGFSAVVLGDLDRGITTLTRCKRLLEAVEATNIVTPCAYATIFAEQHLSAGDLIERALEWARRDGDLATIAWLLAARARLRRDLGRFDDAESDNVEAIDLAAATGGVFAEDTARAQQCWLIAVRGHGDAVERDRQHPASIPHARALQQHALGIYALGTSQNAAAVEALESATADFRKQPGTLPTVIPALGDLAESHARSRHADRFASILAGLEALPGHASQIWRPMTIARLRLFDSRNSNIDTLIADAEHSAARHPSDFERARTALAIGERLRRARRRGESRSYLERAAELFERCAASPWRDRALAELAATGAGTNPDPRDGRGRLTPQEHRVMVEVATGVSTERAARNLFLSPRTVEGHLTRIYRKTGVRSRAELVRLVAESPTSVRRLINEVPANGRLASLNHSTPRPSSGRTMRR